MKVMKKKILYVAPLFEIECEYLLRALRPAFNMCCIHGEWRGFKENQIPEKFPKTGQTLQAYDAVIFSDVGKKNFKAAQLKALQSFVRSGGGFLMIGGYASFAGHELMANYHATVVEEILPVHVSAKSDTVNLVQGFVGKPTVRRHPILQGIDWKILPVAIGYNRVKAKKSSEVLMKYKGDPILVVGKYGEGRTAAFMTDAHPHWSGGWTDWKYYPVFWRNLVGWVARA
jgi:uncharacterized membrane protein